MSPSPLTLINHLYRWGTAIAAPLAMRTARRRMIAVDGPLDRLGERAGHASLPRPTGRLIWLHAVSVGEFLSVLGLVSDLTASGAQVLVTTTTSTAASLAAKRLPEGAFHQFSPIDTPQATRRFLDHWQPDLAIFVESEIWPNQIVACAKRGIPLTLINARLSAKSLNKWQKVGSTACALFTRFDRIMCQTEGTRQALEHLGAASDNLITTGDMKIASPPLPFDMAVAQSLAQSLANRPVWVASSTHPGEEQIISAAHRVVAAQTENALLVLVPRHPERADEILTQLQAEGWTIARRSTGDALTPDTQIYLADTLGETGLWYHLAPIVCVAGSFVPVGGHNPYEPAHFGCAILHGPLYANFDMAYRELAARNAAIEVDSATTLGQTVSNLFTGPNLKSLQDNASRYVLSARNIRREVSANLLALIK